MNKTESTFEPRTMKVEECAKLLGLGKASMYDIVNDALTNHGQPFSVIKLKGKLLVSRKSFNAYLESIDL